MGGKKARIRFIVLLAFGVSASAVGQSDPPLPTTIPVKQVKEVPFGNLRKLNLKGKHGQYALNGVHLPRVYEDVVYLHTKDSSYSVELGFSKTLLLSKGLPITVSDVSLLESWSRGVPLIAAVLKRQDTVASLKPVSYTLVQPKQASGLQMQEEIVYLWSSDPADKGKIGDPNLLPPVPFPGQLTDVQYRGVRNGVNRLFKKIILQILYILEAGHPPAMLGGLLIVSSPSGEFEFYLLPPSLLDRIVIRSK